ncbi:MAG TPA: hypothetical protein PKA64_11625 [Myxococcota bacterium]|nr:hypothetical protein [Myxococcota bacterium]
MIVVAHRRNALADLAATPAELGVEMDVRCRGDRIVVAHDPFEDGPDLDAWLDAYHHALLIVNLKEEGLERYVLPRLADRKIEAFFLLDQSFPFLLRTLRSGERRVAVRVSELEGVETALRLGGQAAWVWLDGFHGFPVGQEAVRALRGAGYRICLVSPELHGRERAEIEGYRESARRAGALGDAVCTRAWGAWSGA